MLADRFGLCESRTRAGRNAHLLLWFKWCGVVEEGDFVVYWWVFKWLNIDAILAKWMDISLYQIRNLNIGAHTSSLSSWSS
jgi:hypothetical protein